MKNIKITIKGSLGRAGHVAHTTGGGVHKNKARNGKGNRSAKSRKAIREG
jgi:hypothetical protein